MGRLTKSRENRTTGTVADWFDDRGYGFIAADDGKRLFFHISEVREHYARARVGDRVTFALGVGRNGKPAAVDVYVAGVNPRPREAEIRGSDRPFARESYRVYGAVLLIVVLMGAIVLDRLPLWLPAIYLVMGCVSAVLYAADKRAAESGAWRTSEATLHIVDLAGGIVGGLLAQHILRHKTAKASFAIATALIAVIHLSLLLIAAGAGSPAAIDAFVGQLLGVLSSRS